MRSLSLSLSLSKIQTISRSLLTKANNNKSEPWVILTQTVVVLILQMLASVCVMSTYRQFTIAAMYSLGTGRQRGIDSQ